MPSLDLGPVVGPQGAQGATGAQGIRGEQGLPGPNQVTNSTATPLTGVLTGNGSVVGVANIDTAPTENSTGFAQSGGTDKAIKARMPVWGMGKNLLRNSDFTINQRGITSGSSSSNAEYTRDGWKTARCSYTFNNDGTVTYAQVSSGYNAFLLQYVSEDLQTKQITVSAKIDGVLQSKTFIPGADYEITLGGGVTVRCTYYSTGEHIGTEFQFKHANSSGITIGPIKVELGTEQTLCHNEGTDANPVWVLNEIPDYDYELFRCMTSTADSTDTYANKTLATGQQLAYVETGATASQAYAVGEYFCWHGLLYKVTVSIQSGGAITPGTNCEPDTVGSEITKFDGLIAKAPGSGTRDAQLQVGTYNSVATLIIASNPRSPGKPDVALDIATDYIRVYYTDSSGTTTTKTYRPAT